MPPGREPELGGQERRLRLSHLAHRDVTILTIAVTVLVAHRLSAHPGVATVGPGIVTVGPTTIAVCPGVIAVLAHGIRAPVTFVVTQRRLARRGSHPRGPGLIPRICVRHGSSFRWLGDIDAHGVQRASLLTRSGNRRP